MPACYLKNTLKFETFHYGSEYYLQGRTDEKGSDMRFATEAT